MPELADRPRDRSGAVCLSGVSAAMAERYYAVRDDSSAVCARAAVAVSHADAVVARAGALLDRAHVICAAVWDGKYSRWCARVDRSTPPSPRRRPPGGHAARRRGRALAVAASAAPDPRDARDARDAGGAHVERWADARVYAARRIPPKETDVGEVFTVRELDARAMPGAHGPRCLVFENHSVVRRVWHYPDDWRRMSDAALLAVAGLSP